MRTTIQQRVMHWAHILYNQSRCNWSTALAVAWVMHSLRHHLTRGVVWFTYRKKDGTLRSARGTLCADIVPPSKAPKGIIQSEVEQGLRQPDYSSIAYYDLDREAWRAFSICHVTSIDDIKALIAFGKASH